jgi:hypothetical protein
MYSAADHLPHWQKMFGTIARKRAANLSVQINLENQAQKSGSLERDLDNKHSRLPCPSSLITPSRRNYTPINYNMKGGLITRPKLLFREW